MREDSDVKKIQAVMQEIGKRMNKPVIVYFAGGASAVLLGMRKTTIDVDLRFEPDLSEKFEVIRDLKEVLNANIELASPGDFVPPLPGWKQRSIFIKKFGKVSFYHYDLYSQVMAKVERGWEQDIEDARNFATHSVDLDELVRLFYQVEKDFIKYPAINFKKLEKRLLEFRNETTR